MNAEESTDTTSTEQMVWRLIYFDRNNPVVEVYAESRLEEALDYLSERRIPVASIRLTPASYGPWVVCSGIQFMPWSQEYQTYKEAFEVATGLGYPDSHHVQLNPTLSAEEKAGVVAAYEDMLQRRGIIEDRGQRWRWLGFSTIWPLLRRRLAY